MNKHNANDIGPIPEEWDVARIADLGGVITGTTPSTKKPEYYGTDFVWVRPADIVRKFVRNSDKKLSKKGFQTVRKVPKNAVLVTCIGATIGKTGMASFEMCTNQQINSVICGPDCDPDFFYYYISSATDRLWALAGKHAMPILSKGKFERILVPVPPLREQQKIGGILSSADDLLNEIRISLQTHRSLKKGLMQRLLTRGIGHTKFKNTKIGDIPQEWTTRKLSELARILSGYSFDSHLFGEEGVPLIRIRDIDKRITETKYSGVYEEKYLVIPGSILVGMDGNFNTRIWRGPKGLLNQRVSKVESASSQLDERFLYYTIMGPIKLLECVIPRTTVKHLSKKDIAGLLIALPPLTEQKRIASILSAVDEKIDLEIEYQIALQALKMGLMQVLLSGRVRVEVQTDSEGEYGSRI